jgi:hypothetical protein
MPEDTNSTRTVTAVFPLVDPGGRAKELSRHR